MPSGPKPSLRKAAQRALPLVATIFLAATLPPKAAPRAPRAQISVQVNVVSVPVTVTSARGEFVSGLGRQNFRLWVDDAEQPIEYFAAEQEPARALVLVETGPAVYLLSHEHIVAAENLLNGLGADDRVAVAGYSDALRPLSGFTADKRQAAAALGALNYMLGMAQLNFYDSLAAAVDWGAPASPSGGGKQAIVLLTTGLDSSGPGHWERLQEKLQQSNVMVLPVALGGDLRDSNVRGVKKGAAPGEGISFAASNQALDTIATETGGHVFAPRSEREWVAAYRRIASLLRHEYNLGFAAGQRDARYHSIRVELVDNRGRPLSGKNAKGAYGVNARRGFLALAP